MTIFNPTGTNMRTTIVAVSKLTVLTACAALLACGTAAARAQAPESGGRHAGQIGAATRAWLELQRGGRAAATPEPMLGEEAGLAYERYMKSFRTKIPSRFGSTLDGGNALRVDYPNVGGGPSAADGQ
ncbi:DUF3613 domain-containing protein [Trinickia caryophylli]|uniref:DUF3613 domain-containing protein n=1 Tax=Trinickia caryophylli TaxID=28094 RepID=A0A1X7G9J4_TRICW|nr:DUF3613 domain-containing protein [Trinickia caryophylli]PMS11378.1 DUF3613 domain-containing protein [Trinickia caryophylli]TRX17572.1 DUF3613 domain-containing protein [Trinickia caryophylli]WQE11676.1 DUF3613 domain-containing protein [Trinickia caryophylli]SMF66356.1 Protein of unknown function [Trinickia caryophylli]GLU34862.1 hypothetical protein Busp01_47040 [Trinickia caryophylli]